MKKTILLQFLGLFMPIILLAQAKEYQVVFDLTSKDTTAHQTILRWIDLITKETPDAQLEVVFYGQSLDMVHNNRSSVANQVSTMAKRPNVSFVVCEVAMKKHNINKSDLVAGVKTVPDGIYQIISRQKQGWGYIKVAQ